MTERRERRGPGDGRFPGGLTRREFVGRGVVVGAGLVAAPALSLGACAPAAPSPPPPANVWAPVSVAGLEPFVPRWVEFAVADLPIETSGGSGDATPAPVEPPALAIATPGGSPGDAQAPGTGGAWLVLGSDGLVTAFAPWCTHLLCLYDYDATRADFLCRCHAGRYNLSGVPIEGPPPRPLWKLETRVTTDPAVIEIGWYRKA